jgi:ABC-type transport system substrate-binding protein
MANRGDSTNPFERPISRRRLLGSAAGGTLALLGGGGLLAACTGDGNGDDASATDTGTGTGTTAESATPGGTLVFGVESPPSGFDPAKWWNSLSWAGTIPVFNRLIRVTDDGGVEPELVDALPEVNAEGTLYTFRLRPGVQFHHGRELTADDVKFSLERLVTPATGSEGGGLYTGLTIPGMEQLQDERANDLPGIKVVDDRTLTVELEQPDSVFLYLLGLPFAGIVPRDVVEDVSGEEFNFAPVGTGPYAMRDVQPSEGLVLERFADHWNQDVGFVDQVQWNIGVAPDLSILRIQDGEQDMMEEEVPAGSLAGVRDNPNLSAQFYEGTQNNILYITLSLKHDALKDLKVRQAIAHGVDRERLVRAYRGVGEPATGGLFSPLSPYFQEGLAYEFDQDMARQLLEEAGYGDGFDVPFWSGNFTPYKEIGETVTEDLKQLGINVDLNQMIREQWLAEVVKNPAGITNNQWELPYPHGSYVMDGAFTEAAIEAGCCNFSNYVSAEFDQLVAEAHRTSDEVELVELYKQMDTIAVKDEALWVPLVYPGLTMLVSERLKGYEIPTSPAAQQKFFERYWIEEA